MREVGFSAETFTAADEFLQNYADTPTPPRCLVLDVRMPGMSGLALQEKLAAEGIRIPIIMISGSADVQTAVRAMNAGALDFFEKPFHWQSLLERIHKAIEQDAAGRRREARRADVRARLARLSPREREVNDLLVYGKHNKQIASEFGISQKTVAKHRSRVLEKMEVDSLAELADRFDRLLG